MTLVFVLEFLFSFLSFFFFFQAEDGIRDWSVTGVQTCALPILEAAICWPHEEFYLGPKFKVTSISSQHIAITINHNQQSNNPTIIITNQYCKVLFIHCCKHGMPLQIGRASCRERVQISVVAVSLKKKNKTKQIGRAHACTPVTDHPMPTVIPSLHR